MKASGAAGAARKRGRRAAASTAGTHLVGDAAFLLEKATPRVLWTGEREEAGDQLRGCAGREAQARIAETLALYVARMHVRSPLSWFREADVVISWKHPVRDPLALLAELCVAQGASPDACCARILDAENLSVLLEEAVQGTLKNGDTCREIAKERLFVTAFGYLTATIDKDLCSHDMLEHGFDAAKEDAYACLSRVKEGATVYTCSALRGVMDRRFAHFLAERKGVRAQPQWEASTAMTQEQAGVFREVAQHLRRRGWSVLSGCGGSGKTYMLKHIQQLCAESYVEAPGDPPDCPSCGEVRLAMQCRACGHAREKEGSRPFRICFMAPTNRAVAVLIHALGPPTAHCLVGTVHSLARRRELPQQDLLVVDEASMLGAEHGDLVLRCEAFQKAALLLVGDHMQLPPVGPGELLRPLLAWSGLPALMHNARAKTSGLAGLIESIRKGDAQAALACERHFATPLELMHGIAAARCDLVVCLRNEERVLYNAFELKKRPVSNLRLAHLDDYRKIAPDWSATSAPPRSFVPFVGLPVRVQTNAHRPVACKGSLGCVTEVAVHNRLWRLRFSVEDGFVDVESTYFSIPEFLRPAYAITLHDAQGAQRPRVGVVFPPSARSPLVTQESLYTAASRAQEDLILFTSGDTLTSMLPYLSAPSPLRSTPLAILVRQMPPLLSSADSDGRAAPCAEASPPS